MRDTIKRAVEIGHREGILSLVKKSPPYIYQLLWPCLPSGRLIIKNSVDSSQKAKIFDDILPQYITKYTPSDDPDYEEQYIDCIRRYVNQGEKIILVGGGEGISTVASAKQVQSNGAVEVFEGGASEVRKTNQTVQINDVGNLVTVHHAIVSTDFSLRSSANGAEIIPPSGLPECDTLGIDADGAEIPILKDLTIQPKRLIIEHHAVPDSRGLVVKYQPDKIRSLIQDLGYEIIEEQVDPTRAFGSEERIFVAEQT